MGPEGVILTNPPITTFQQSLTHSAMCQYQRLVWRRAGGWRRRNSAGLRPSSAPALEGKAGRSRWELLNKDLAFKLEN